MCSTKQGSCSRVPAEALAHERGVWDSLRVQGVAAVPCGRRLRLQAIGRPAYAGSGVYGAMPLGRRFGWRLRHVLGPVGLPSPGPMLCCRALT